MIIRARKCEDLLSFYIDLMLAHTVDYVVNIDLAQILSMYGLRTDRDVPNQRDQNGQKKHDRKVPANAEKTQRRIDPLHARRAASTSNQSPPSSDKLEARGDPATVCRLGGTS